MMDVFEPTVEFNGPAAEHNMPCAVHGDEHAVLQANTGVFLPSWKAQKEGWRLVKIPPKRKLLTRFIKRFDKKAEGNLGGHLFDVNFHGAHMLGFIMKDVDEHSIPIEDNFKQYGIVGGIPSTRFKMPATDCRRAAKKLRELQDDQIRALYRDCNFRSNRGPERTDFLDLIEDWTRFLETCSGYRVPA